MANHQLSTSTTINIRVGDETNIVQDRALQTILHGTSNEVKYELRIKKMEIKISEESEALLLCIRNPWYVDVDFFWEWVSRF